MNKETKGIPGVKMDRWKEAHVVRHCALSLVGVPIMYPRINELLGELHRRSISTFLVQMDSIQEPSRQCAVPLNCMLALMLQLQKRWMLLIGHFLMMHGIDCVRL